MVQITEKNKEYNKSDRPGSFLKFAVSYARVSTVHQSENGISLDIQRDSIATFAEHAGYTIIETFQDAVSGMGAKSLYARKGLLDALEMAAREGADLLVWDWDRLSRYAAFKKQVAKYLPDKSRIICVKDGSQIKEASKKAVFAHNEASAAKISFLTKQGMKKKRDEGVMFGNPEIKTIVQPLGAAVRAQNSRDLTLKIVDILRLLPDETEKTYAEIAEILNKEGLSTLHGKEWNKHRVRKPVTRAREILESEFYDPKKPGSDFGTF